MSKRKIFIVAGEASGDALGAWFIAQQVKRGVAAEYTAVGGSQLRRAGADLYCSFARLTAVGIVEIIRHLPRLRHMLYQLADHVASAGYDEVVLVDFPGFNIRLGSMLKKRCPHVRITYLSPPQMWVWGAWRVRRLQAIADRVIVLYPFEVAWYRERQIPVEFWGCPLLAQALIQREQKVLHVVCLPGSRRQEIAALLPLFAQALRKVSFLCADLTIDIVVAPTVPVSDVRRILAAQKASMWGCRVCVITDEADGRRAMARAVCALTKPGTNTLELALMGTPGVVAYRTSWITYAIARAVVTVDSMTLPNLLSGKRLYPELIQGECTPDRIAQQLQICIAQYRTHPAQYAQRCERLRNIRQVLEE